MFLLGRVIIAQNWPAQFMIHTTVPPTKTESTTGLKRIYTVLLLPLYTLYCSHANTECLQYSIRSRYTSANMHSSFLFILDTHRTQILFIIINRFWTTYTNNPVSKSDNVITASRHFILKIRNMCWSDNVFFEKVLILPTFFTKNLLTWMIKISD